MMIRLSLNIFLNPKKMNLKNQIYENLKKVPKGRVITYKELASACNSRAYRYVGYCMKNNKSPEKIPCYKAVNSNGKVGNYSAKGGIKTKIKLLKKDGVKVVNRRVDLEKYGWTSKQQI